MFLQERAKRQSCIPQPDRLANFAHDKMVVQRCSVGSGSDPASSKQLDQAYYKRDDQYEVNNPGRYLESEYAKRPKDEQDERDGQQHFLSPCGATNHVTATNLICERAAGSGPVNESRLSKHWVLARTIW